MSFVRTRWAVARGRRTGRPARVVEPDPAPAPAVASLPWRNGTLGQALTLLGGFQASDGSRWGRPVAAVAGPDRAIAVTDDAVGAGYRMSPS